MKKERDKCSRTMSRDSDDESFVKKQQGVADNQSGRNEFSKLNLQTKSIRVNRVVSKIIKKMTGSPSLLSLKSRHTVTRSVALWIQNLWERNFQMFFEGGQFLAFLHSRSLKPGNCHES